MDAGRNGGRDSGGSGARDGGGRAGRPVRLPEKVAVALPAGTRERIERAATEAGMPPADWHRRLIRRALDAARKARARRAS